MPYKNREDYNRYKRKYRKRNREKLKEQKEIYRILKQHYPHFLEHIKQQYLDKPQPFIYIPYPTLPYTDVSGNTFTCTIDGTATGTNTYNDH